MTNPYQLRKGKPMIKLKYKLIYETLKLVESQGEKGLLCRNKQSDAEFMRPVNEFAAASGRNYTSIKSTLDIMHKNWSYLQRESIKDTGLDAGKASKIFIYHLCDKGRSFIEKYEKALVQNADK